MEKDLDTTRKTEKNISNTIIDSNLVYGNYFLVAWYKFIEAQPAHLVNRFVVVDNDSISFPTNPKLGSRIDFKGILGEQSFFLKVRREVLGEIGFHFEVKQGSQIIFEKHGIAILQPGFWLASEIDEDDKTGESYPSNEYSFNENGCVINIRISENDTLTKSKSLVIYGCSEMEKKEEIEMIQSPTLNAVN